MMVAAYIGVFSLASGMPLPVAIVTMILGTIVVGLLIERIAYRPLRGAPEVALLLTSFAVGQILQNSVLLLTRLVGRPIQIAFPAPDVLSGVVNVGSLTISKVNLGSFLVGVVVLVAADRLRQHDAARAVHARRRRGPRRGTADGHPRELRGGGGLRHRCRPGGHRGPLLRGSDGPDQPLHGLHAGPQGLHRGRHRRLREPCWGRPGRLRAGLPGGPADGPLRHRATSSRPAPSRRSCTTSSRRPSRPTCRATAMPSSSCSSSSCCSSGPTACWAVAFARRRRERLAARP